jgi:pyruvate dehydrogenase (quinone)
VSQALPDVDYAAFARSLGLIGINISTVDELTAGWDRALAADRPVLLDVICDPSVPPVPPHATFEQAKALGSAVLHGDDDAWDVVRQGLKQKAQQYLPGMPGHKD